MALTEVLAAILLSIASSTRKEVRKTQTKSLHFRLNSIKFTSNLTIYSYSSGATVLKPNIKYTSNHLDADEGGLEDEENEQKNDLNHDDTHTKNNNNN